MHRTLDRIKQFDERSRNFAAVDTIPDPYLRSYTWSCDVYNDQGSEGACVGFSWSHELSARPKVYRVYEDFARKIYYRAQRLDPWPGEDYEGTSVLAGAKAVMELSGSEGLPLIQEYRWAFGIEEVVRVIGRRGPMVFGLDWYDGMFETNPSGFISPTGEARGGHAILGKGVACRWKDIYGPHVFSNLDLDKSFVKFHNSWGRSWGVDGVAKITVRDLGFLLNNGGEACIPMRRTV